MKNLQTPHNSHSNNTAEMSAILTTLHIVPPDSTVKIFTDSEISTKIIYNANYKGQFKQVKEEIDHLTQEKRLMFSIQWTIEPTTQEQLMGITMRIRKQRKQQEQEKE